MSDGLHDVGSVMGRFVAVIAVVLCNTAPVLGALHEFTLRGTVTSSDHVDVSVGEPFSITYVANSIDLDPSATLGRYSAARLTAVFPQTTIVNAIGGSVSVELDASAGADSVRYLTVNPNVNLIVVDFSFPAGTLRSDELPRSLPLANATGAGFYWASIYPYFNLAGDITSYTSTEVPEPAYLKFVLLVCVYRNRTRRLRMPRRRAS
jgi:hypothetical protein